MREKKAHVHAYEEQSLFSVFSFVLNWTKILLTNWIWQHHRLNKQEHDKTKKKEKKRKWESMRKREEKKIWKKRNWISTMMVHEIIEEYELENKCAEKDEK